MLHGIRSFRPSQALPRMLADLLIVHLCMLAGLLLPIFYQLSRGETTWAALRLGEARHYYFPYFILLSPWFPMVFLGHGFYTRSRAYTGRYKMMVVLQGAVIAILSFLAVNFLLFRAVLVPRAALLIFCFLSIPALALTRWSKAVLEGRYEIKLKHPKPSVQSDGDVLVVGGAGYIGSVLVRKLLEGGHRVRVLDSLVYGDKSLHSIFGHPHLEMRVGDCRNIQDMVSAMKGMGTIIHLAAIVGDPACEVDRQTALEVNYAATRMLLEVAKGNGIRRLIFASSCSVYGATNELMDENSGLQPVSLYGQTKVDSEEAVLRARSDKFHPTVLRLATVFGWSYRPRFDLVVNLLAAQAYLEKTITIFNGNQWRPFIHVQDVAEGMCRILKAPLPIVSGQVFNLGDNQMNFTLAEVGQKIVEIFPDTQVQRVDNTDRRNYRVVFDKIYNHIHFKCSIGVEQGVEELRRAFQEKQILDYRNAQYYNQDFLQLAGSPSRKDELDEHIMAAFARAPASSLRPASASLRAGGAR